MDFSRKARWVLDGHKQADPECCTYAGVVSRESVRIALIYAALNGLEVCATDIRNAYLQAPSSNKDYIICSPWFGIEHEGKVALIHRALYGGKAQEGILEIICGHACIFSTSNHVQLPCN
jgi:hypothetical protein